VLDIGLFEHLHVVEVLAQPWIEDLFFDRRVHRKLAADFRRDGAPGVLVAFLLAVVLLEEVLHLAVVGHE
jgi:hypothetical protein